jgi:hypothetical protein
MKLSKNLRNGKPIRFLDCSDLNDLTSCCLDPNCSIHSTPPQSNSGQNSKPNLDWSLGIEGLFCCKHIHLANSMTRDQWIYLGDIDLRNQIASLEAIGIDTTGFIEKGLIKR